jgi:hypothetical protein
MLVRFVLAPAYGLMADTFAVAAHFGAGAGTARIAAAPAETPTKLMKSDESLDGSFSTKSPR